MSKNPRKSIVASFGLLSASLENSDAEVAPAASDPSQAQPPQTTRVGAGVIGAAHRAIGDIRAERDRLRAIIESGEGSIHDLDPKTIDPSPYPDRLPDDDPKDFDSFKRSIETEGQKVPIQVRRHPSAEGRYQVVYGHRRWRAALELGRPVRSIEVEISDLDLVVAQGIENASRQDLTWIERVLFASRMDDAGIKARDIYAALSIEHTELARMRSVYRSVPADVIEAIGRAPKIGRPRWIDFAKTISSTPGALEAARNALKTTDKAPASSNERFQRALGAVKPASEPQVSLTSIADAAGDKLVTLLKSARDVRISADGPLGLEFLKFVENEMPDLVERFTRQRNNRNA
ncbi:plasmid partitioning protein RepB [Rhizobium sp. P38BS-XIX]|uniref:plasmid partitioning protein RepB n=1 Tax=Rhizobium sp. P38BS-XIX TaxID=2726740 RepID=UPI0014568FA9|nr:plasmid partitioning protein RepB [Rhizobium sp. P38BS-XIX]NLS01543.1 plasmid partitioning protein RepB [Rhizobium sp. P38BS-XIX]